MNPDTLLRWTFRANALFSTLSGTALLVRAVPIAALIGAPEPRWVAVVGALLLCFAAALVFLSRLRTIPSAAAWPVVAGDALWVACSIAALVFLGEHISTAGKYAIAAVADVVAIFGLIQAYALRCLHRATAATART